MSAISFSVETITPECAKAYLSLNLKNRPIKKDRVDAYARDMLNGKWDMTHQGIAFNQNGKLIDGQHRLLAIIKSNTPVQMMVARGVVNAGNIDHNASRSVIDSNKMSGLTSMYTNKYVVHGVSGYIKYRMSNHNGVLTTNDINKFIDENKAIIETIYHLSTRFGKANSKGDAIITSPVITASISALYNGEKAEDVIAFVQMYCKSAINDRYKCSSVVRLKNMVQKQSSKLCTREKISLCENAIHNFIHKPKKDKWDGNPYQHTIASEGQSASQPIQ